MDDNTTLAFYKLCSDCNLRGLMDTFGDLSDTTNIEMNYAYYIVYNKQTSDNSKLLEWLLEKDPNINQHRIDFEYRFKGI